MAITKFFSTFDRLLTQGEFRLMFYNTEKCSASLTFLWRNAFHGNCSTNTFVEDFTVGIDTATSIGKLVLFSQRTRLIQKPEVTLDVEISYQRETSTWPLQLSQQHLKHNHIKPGLWDETPYNT